MRGRLNPGYPASSATSWGLAVGAVNSSNQMASFSNRAGSNSSMSYVTAPGVQVYSTLPNGGYGFLSGTSMATPHVAGVVALMLSANPNLTDAQVAIRNCFLAVLRSVTYCFMEEWDEHYRRHGGAC
ncbi:MAG UNVERIFIED_CONTAM: S8 family serine peptidase [Microcystis novacekii LVE1205-3]